MNYIYALIDPLTNNIRYIGKTVNLASRYSFHVNDKSNTYKVNWIKSLQTQNLKPIMVVIDKCKYSWQDREKFWIAHFKKMYKLTNLTAGGDGLLNPIKTKKRAVTAYNLDGSLYKKYSSILEASKDVKVKSSHIVDCCNGTIKTCGKKIWIYSENKFVKKSLNDKAKPIMQYDLKDNFIKEFSSISEAALNLGCKAQSISRVLRGERNKIKNFKFKYKDIV
ncbi:MAG: NUMOD1 domain-containing DNA-binding protein [Bacteroidota bacterium]|jgi:hypothetical protein